MGRDASQAFLGAGHSGDAMEMLLDMGAIGILPKKERAYGYMSGISFNSF